MLKTWFRLMMAVITMLYSLAASAAVLTPNDIFAWVQKDFPSIFAPAISTGRTTFLGYTYDFRYYPTNGGVYIGVRLENDHVYTFNVVGPGLVDHGHIDTFKCDARPDLCGAATFAGTLMFSGDGGTSVTIAANYKNNWLWGVGADGKGFEVPVGEIDAICAHSIRLGNWGKQTGTGCAVPQANGELKITNLPNNDCSRFTAWSKGKEYWLDLESPTGYKVTGLNAKLNASCGIEYGPSGFTQAKISAVREPDNTASLVFDFGSDFLGGFFGRDGQPVVIDHPTKPYVFVWNGSHAGKGYDHGWGLGIGRKTTEGYDVQASIRWAWLEFANGRFFAKFKNLACADKGNATVYVGSGPANNVVYNFGSDGFGLGWAGLPYQANTSTWTAGSGVTYDREKGQLQYGVPFCTQK